MNRRCSIGVFLVLMVVLMGCGEKTEKNRVDIEQINHDNSNNYRYIFREQLKEEEYWKKKRSRDPFKDESEAFK